MKKFGFLLMFFLVAAAVHAAPAKVSFTNDGFINIDGVRFTMVWMDLKWRTTTASDRKNDPVWKPVKISSNEMIYKINTPSGAAGTVTLKITASDRQEYRLTADAAFDGPCRANFFGLVAQRLSVSEFGGANYVINGKKHIFPQEYDVYRFWNGMCKEFQMPTSGGHAVFTGPFFLYMHDSRHWKVPAYALRLGFDREKTDFTSASLDMPIKIMENDFSLGNIIRPPYEVKADKEWAPVENHQDTVAGTALDFSGRIKTPAGNLGFLKVRGDKFYFEKAPDKAVKFFGTNLFGTTQVISKEQSEILAKRLAAFGFNSVRIHQHDNEICDRKDTRLLNKELTDNFDYLVYCLKKNGLYITIDVYTARRGITREELPKYGPITSAAEYKALLWIDDDVFQNWKDAAKNFYTRINPYTKKSLLDDPVLISVNLVNEGNPSSWRSVTGRAVNLYNKAFAEYRKIKGCEKADMDDFCAYLAAKRYREMKEYMLSLGCKVPMSDQNFECNPSLSWARAVYDYVDNHRYWDHPRFVGKSWGLPIAPSQVNVLKEVSNVPSQLFSTRVFGKPFFVTEFDYATPNIHRLHGPALFASYAAFQEWDGMFQFAYSHSGPMAFSLDACGHFFDLARDPAKALAYKLAAKIFLYGKVKPADTVIAYVPPRKGMESWQSSAESLGFVAKIGSDVGQSSIKFDKKLDASFFNQKDAFMKLVKSGVVPKGRITSSGKFFYTPQLVFDAKRGIFRLKAEGAEVISLQAEQTLKGTRLEVKNVTAESTIAIIPHDTDSLTSAKRIVLFHLTDMQSAGRYFSNRSMSQMDSWGTVPFLVKRGSAEVALKLKGGNWKVYSLALNGVRKGEIPYTVDKEGRIILRLNTADQMACEIVRE